MQTETLMKPDDQRSERATTVIKFAEIRRNAQKYTGFSTEGAETLKTYIEFGTEGTETLRNMWVSAPKLPKRLEICRILHQKCRNA